MEIDVIGGTIKVESVDIMREADNIIILEIATEQKYPSLGGYCSGVMMTLWPEEGDCFDTTMIKFCDPRLATGNWIQVMDVDRYTIHVVLYKHDEESRKQIWPSTLG